MSFNTLTCDELFSKLKSTEITKASRSGIGSSFPQSMALVSSFGSGTLSGGSMSGVCAFSRGFALSSLVSITKEQVDTLYDEELALIDKKFTRFYNDRRDQRRGGSRGCFECGDLNHIKAICPKLKATNEHEQKYQQKDKKLFYKGKRGKVAKRMARAFVAALSDIDNTSSEDPNSDEDERDKNDKKMKDFNGLCFMANGKQSSDEPDISEMEHRFWMYSSNDGDEIVKPYDFTC
ncbi:hypothetical protein GUJ93_ZPchr0013g35232 [Zizania palustris]|uniref:CCHC-type domain-containing protein n=1 Tax=Zizania palustris TaxID=103762 RepID=A0A8J5WS87_ZIZPA|nr:hypothetical protein GUJ93_ZPchr0013g35232 [Zizania palustris]